MEEEEEEEEEEVVEEAAAGSGSNSTRSVKHFYYICSPPFEPLLAFFWGGWVEEAEKRGTHQSNDVEKKVGKDERNLFFGVGRKRRKGGR